MSSQTFSMHVRNMEKSVTIMVSSAPVQKTRIFAKDQS